MAAERPRWGYRRIHTLLRREGWAVNRKRVQRLYREPLGRPNERWSLDFASDTLSNGRTFRCLTVLDEFSRECVAIHVAHSIPAVRVIDVLERLKEERGLPEIVITDNGSEFTSRAFDAWAYARGIKIEYIQPGKPVQNCFVESFIGSFRDECLNLHWFVSIHDARRTIEDWRKDYNRVRPHSLLGDLTPEEFVKNQTLGEQSLAPDISSTVPE